MGVAGLHRILARLDLLRSAAAVVVVAGMEGALASVIGGLTSVPVVAVPTSVGYGANLGGITGRAQKSEGTLVSTGSDSLLTTIVQTDPIWVRFSIADNELDKQPKRQVNKASVKGVQIVTADGEAPLPGKLNFAASSIDPKLGTLQLRAELANPDNSLLPGQFVRVKLITGEREGVFLVPQTAVLSSDKGKFVFVVGPDSKAQPRPVQTGDWQGKDWVILGGLKAGDKIITDNLMKVRPDAPVKIQPAGARPDAGKPQAGKA